MELAWEFGRIMSRNIVTVYRPGFMTVFTLMSTKQCCKLRRASCHIYSIHYLLEQQIDCNCMTSSSKASNKQVVG